MASSHVVRNRIAAARRDRRMTRDVLSAAVGVSPMTIWRHEVHLRAVPDALKHSYARALDMSLDMLFDFDRLVSVSDAQDTNRGLGDGGSTRRQRAGGVAVTVTRPGTRRRRRSHRASANRAGAGAPRAGNAGGHGPGGGDGVTP